jgi:hypothetical protein
VLYAAMIDCALIAGAALFFAACLAYVAGCDGLHHDW